MLDGFSRIRIWHRTTQVYASREPKWVLSSQAFMKRDIRGARSIKPDLLVRPVSFQMMMPTRCRRTRSEAIGKLFTIFDTFLVCFLFIATQRRALGSRDVTDVRLGIPLLVLFKPTTSFLLHLLPNSSKDIFSLTASLRSSWRHLPQTPYLLNMAQQSRSPLSSPSKFTTCTAIRWSTRGHSPLTSLMHPRNLHLI